jgi:hypothetical protein
VRKAKKSGQGRKQGDLAVVYTRLHRDDLALLREREATVGVPIAVQIRMLVRDGLRARGVVK